jgi:hypothetical protein
MDCNDAGAPYCRPIATGQPCYTGAQGTRGHGTCKDGVQTCEGVGACVGEVLPLAHENCFNADDDDCDGVPNNGCPDHLAIGTFGGLVLRGGTGGANARNVYCPANSFVTRSTFYLDNTQGHASGVAIYCAAPTLVQGASTYSVTLTPITPAPYLKVVGDNPTIQGGDYDCGITGLVAGSWLVGLADSFVEALGMHCSNGAVSMGADNTLTFNFTQTGAGSFYGYQTGTPFEDDCPPHQVLVGYNLKQGDWLDSIQAVCAPLVTVYK